MEQLKVLELFAGIGACSKALTNLGIPHKIVDAVEIDKYAIKSFNAIHGTNFEPQDITKWDKDIEVDFIMHGSPCQDFSVAGKGAGGDKGSGTRSSLMYETIRIVDKLRPKYVLWENVKNLLSEKHRPNYFAYIKAMTNMGYKSFGRVLNAKDFGVPQNRERIYTLSIRADDDPQFEFPEGKPLGKRLRDVLEDTVDEKYYLTDKQVEKFMNSTFNQYRTRLQEGDVSQTILARDWKDPKCVRIGGLYDSPGHKHQAGSVWHTGGLVGTLSTMQGGNQEPIIVEDFYKSREPREYKEVAPTLRSERSGLKVIETGSQAVTTRGKDIASTIRSSIYKQGARNIGENIKNGRGYEGVIEGSRIRKLTPKECWRLMGFDDADFEKAQKVNSNTQLYKQAGNSIVVNVLMAIFDRLFYGESSR